MKNEQPMGSIIYIIAALMICVCSCRPTTTNKDESINKLSIELPDSISSSLKIESESGKSYMVVNKAQDLSAFYQNKILWTANIGKRFTEPVPGNNSIRSIELQNDCIFLIYGKHCFVKIDTLNGNIKDIECD